MANVYAIASGNWSNTAIWNTGALPTSADDVFANGSTVTVDISPTVLSIKNASGPGISASGSFALSNGITLTATNGILSGQAFVTCVTLSGSASATVNASILASSTGDSTVGLTHSGSGTLTLTGNVVGGIGHGNSTGLRVTGGGILNLNGNITGSTHARGVHITSATTVNITGNVTGGTGNPGLDINSVTTVNITGAITGANQNGVNNTSGGTINITGSVTSTGTSNGVSSSAGTVNITGTCTGGSSTGAAFVNSSTGTITHIGTAQASATAPAIGAGAVGQVTILTGPLLSTDASYIGATPSGVNPCIALRWFPADTALSTFEYRMRGQTLSGSPSARPARQLFLTDAYAATYPTAANVRSAITYGPGNIYTGTLAVPPPGSVALGVPVDNTTGTAALTADQIRAAIGLASANLDAQLDALPTAVEIAQAVWTYSTRLLSSVSDIVSGVWAATTRTVTGGTIDSVASLNTSARAEIATAVRSELATELSRIDVATSTRLAPSGTLARVTLTDTATAITDKAAIADAVRTELTPELDRVINTATTQEVAEIVEGALQTP